MSGAGPDPRSAPLGALLRHYGLAPKRRYGQHFLADPGLLERIAAAAGPLTGRHVIEVGPGPGGLTRALLARNPASLTAIEIDRTLLPLLEALAAESAGRLRVIAADALTLDAATLVPAPRLIVANLPYNAATALLVRWLRGISAFERLVLMFQREVAERLVAPPGSPAYGRLSVLTQWLAEPRLLFTVPPGAFVPPPAVYSALVLLTPRPAPDPRLVPVMERLTQCAFGQRRKMLRASLRALGGERLLAEAGIAPERRAETLNVAEFLALAGVLARGGGGMDTERH